MYARGTTNWAELCMPLCVSFPPKTIFWAMLWFSNTDFPCKPKLSLTYQKASQKFTVHTNDVTQSSYAFWGSPCTLLWCGFTLVLEGQWDTISDCKWWLWHLGQWRRTGGWFVLSVIPHRDYRGELLHTRLAALELSPSIFPFMLLLTGLKIVHLYTHPHMCALFNVPPLTCPPVNPSCMPLFSPTQVPWTGLPPPQHLTL